MVLTLAALTLATFLQPPQAGAISLDWSKWKATVEAWGIVLLFLFATKLLVAQWKVHKEDQLEIVKLRESLAALAKAKSNAIQAQRLLEQVVIVQDTLESLLKQTGWASPLSLRHINANQDGSVPLPAVYLYGMQCEYKSIRRLASAACLDVREATPMADSCELFAYPCEFSTKEVTTNIEKFKNGLRVYAAKASEEVVKLTISAIDHT